MEKIILTGFSDEISRDFDTQLECISEFGLKYIELRSADGVNVSDFSGEKLAEIGAKLNSAGIRVSSVGSPLGKTSILDPMEPELERMRRTLEIAAFLEAPYIRLFSFYIPKGGDPALYRDEVMERLSRFIELARGYGIKLLHENEKGIFGDNAERCLDIMESLSCPDFAAVFDFANFIEVSEDTLNAYAKLKPYIEYVHIKDAKRDTKEIVPAGAGDGNLREILSDLISHGYEGFLSLEPHLVNFAGLSSLEKDPKKREERLTPKEAWKLALDSLKALLASISGEES